MATKIWTLFEEEWGSAADVEKVEHPVILDDRKYSKNQDLTENILAIWKKRVLYHPLYPTNIQNKENIDIFGFIKS